MASTEYLIKIHPVVLSSEEQNSFVNQNQIAPFNARGRSELTKRVDSVINSLKTLLKDFENIKSELEFSTPQDKENQSANQNQNQYEFSFERAKEAHQLSLSFMTKDLRRQLEGTFDTYKYFKKFFNSPDFTVNESGTSKKDLLRIRSSTLLDINKITFTAPTSPERSPHSRLHVLIDRENDTLSIQPDRVSMSSVLMEDDIENSPFKARERLFKDISPIHLPQPDATFSRHCYLLGTANSECPDETVDRINGNSSCIKNMNLLQLGSKNNSNFKQASCSKVKSEKDMSTEL